MQHDVMRPPRYLPHFGFGLTTTVCNHQRTLFVCHCLPLFVNNGLHFPNNYQIEALHNIRTRISGQGFFALPGC